MNMLIPYLALFAMSVWCGMLWKANRSLKAANATFKEEERRNRGIPSGPYPPAPAALDFIAKAKRLARSADNFQEGPMPNGQADEVFGGNVVFLIFDSRGRVFQMQNGVVSGGMMHRITAPRLQVGQMMDEFGVEDFDPALWEARHDR